MSTDPFKALASPHPAGYGDLAIADARTHLGAARVVDVREVSEFNAELGHIAGAELVPLATVPAVASGWNRDATYILVCRSGGRSGQAAAALARAGFTRVYNLRGGMLAWNDAGLPVTRS